MTIEEAKNILWSDCEWLSDSQIEWIIKLFDMFAKLTISQHISNKKSLLKSGF